ncbi:hypothetical protein Ocin01_04425 [Orchesella cincta]|uniref:C2H2-type domain-containing protein n=1 Tax=Orchesella cincta TaxID=48709 RepID=A0A1D2NAJ4_ORCCI|nr:hypothetical protein Ocin01_04425 [Orchesella cincta]
MAANGEVEKKTGSDITSAAPDAKSESHPIRDGTIACACECNKKVKDLEAAMNLISVWKVEVDKWMLSNFGFAVSISSPGGPDEILREVDNPHDNCTNSNNSNVDPLGNDAENGPSYSGEQSETNDMSFMNTEETENVEISPEIFSHFLLGQDSEESEEELMNCDDEEEIEIEQPDDERPRRLKRRRNGDDSDSSIYSVTASSSESISSDDDDYMPKRGKGRGSIPLTSRVSPKKPSSSTNSKPGKSASSTSKDQMDHKTRLELVKHMQKRPGNIWECTICNFMLSDFSNMLLHIKYNHSTTTHTCSHCRAVVLCRSPKDAMIHEAQCKSRPNIINSRCIPPAPVRKLVKPRVPPARPDDSVNAKVDKFVSDLLNPGPSSSSIPSKNRRTNFRPIIGKVKQKPAGPLAVVTLSSDEES